MNLSNLIYGLTNTFVENMIWLGEQPQWLTFKDIGNGRSDLKLDWDIIKKRPDVLKYMQNLYRRTGEKGGKEQFLAVMWIDTVSRLAADGPKLFRPTAEQCEAMEHVRINLPLREYRQPYPALMIEYPPEYLAMIRQRLARDADQFVAPFYENLDGKVDSVCPISQKGNTAGLIPVSQYPIPNRIVVREHLTPDGKATRAFFSGTVSQPSNDWAGELTNFYQDRDEYGDIEDWLHVHVDQGKVDACVSEMMTRVAMNLCMLLSHHPHACGASAPAVLERARNNRRPDKAEVNRIESKTHVHFLRFSQEIIVRKKEAGPRPESQGGTHASPRPHWRDGHWRGQRHGAGNLLTKKIFINPVMVNAELFTGRKADTSAVYTAAGKAG